MPITLAILRVKAAIEFIDRQKDDVGKQMALRRKLSQGNLEWAFLVSRLRYLEDQRTAAMALLQDLEKHQFRAEFLPMPKAAKATLRRPRERKRA